MCDRDIGFVGYAIPEFPACSSTLDGECHVAEDRRNRAAPEMKSGQSYAGIFEIDGIGKSGAGGFRVQLEEQVVISGYDDAVLVRQAAEPIVEVFYGFDGAAICREIPGVDKNVAAGNGQVSMITMRVADADDFDALSLARFACLRG